jgi:hypothetical protein
LRDPACRFSKVSQLRFDKDAGAWSTVSKSGTFNGHNDFHQPIFKIGGKTIAAANYT